MSFLEVCAVILALAYVILAIFQRRLCWIAAIASASLYILIFWQVRLYLEAALQVFYIAMAVYGWLAWQKKDDESQTPIHMWSPRQHTLACSAASSVLPTRTTASRRAARRACSASSSS